MEMKTGWVFILALAMMLNSLEAIQISESTESADLDMMFGDTPVDQMIKSIDAQVASDTRKAVTEEHSHTAVLGRSLDDDLEVAARMRAHGHDRDVGEGNDEMQGSHSQARATDKSKALKALREAQEAFTHVQSSHSTHKSPGAPALTSGHSSKQQLSSPATPGSETTEMPLELDGNNSEDPIDEMKSLIRSQVRETTRLNTKPEPEDRLDRAIDQIPVVRAQVQANMHKKKPIKGDRAAEGTASVVLLQELANAPGDPGETMPPSKNAPPGPPNPPVKEVTKEVPARQALARSTPQAPAPGAGLDSALAQEKGPASKTGPADAAPPPPDSDFSEQEIKHEMEAIGAYPVDRDQAIKEYVSKMVPWHQRPDPPNKSVKGPPTVEKKVETSSPKAVSNATSTSNTTGNATAVNAAIEKF